MQLCGFQFDIFSKYKQLITPTGETDNWVNSEAMKELLVANRQLGLMTSANKSSDPEFDIFYNIKDIKEAAAAASVSLSVHEEERSNSNGSDTPLTKGGRHTRKK